MPWMLQTLGGLAVDMSNSATFGADRLLVAPQPAATAGVVGAVARLGTPRGVAEVSWKCVDLQSGRMDLNLTVPPTAYAFVTLKTQAHIESKQGASPLVRGGGRWRFQVDAVPGCLVAGPL